MSTAQEIVSLLQLLAALDPLAKENVERALGVELVERASSNRFFRCYEGAPGAGWFSAVELRVPGEGATSKETMLNLDVRADTSVGEDDFDRALVDEIAHINPNKPPEGTISYRHLVGRRTVLLQFTARSKRLLLISLRAAAP